MKKSNGIDISPARTPGGVPVHVIAPASMPKFLNPNPPAPMRMNPKSSPSLNPFAGFGRAVVRAARQIGGR